MKNIRSGFTLVEVIIVCALIALLAALTIPNLLRSKVTANDTASLSFIKGLSTALETYAAANLSRYPVAVSLDDLASSDFATTNPPYMQGLSLKTPQFGHNVIFASSVAGYQIAANTITVNTSGSKNYRMSTGSVLESQEASDGDYSVTAP